MENSERFTMTQERYHEYMLRRTKEVNTRETKWDNI